MAKLTPKPTTPEPKAEDAALAEYESFPVSVETIPITLEMVKKHIAPTATQGELFMFMGIARSLGLNPFKREIHFVKYGNSPGTTVVGYEVFLQRAESTGNLDGWEVHTEKDDSGEKAILTIYRKDWAKPFIWETPREEFDTGKSTWKQMPSFMLKKVCIGQGFRLCFPGALSGMPLLPEEVGVGGTNGYQAPRMQPTLNELRGEYFKALEGRFKDDEERKKKQAEVTGKESVAMWVYDDFDKMFQWLAMQDEPAEEAAIETEVVDDPKPEAEDADVIEIEMSGPDEELDLLAGKDVDSEEEESGTDR